MTIRIVRLTSLQLRSAVIAVAMLLALVLTTGNAWAFEPPADPNDNFSCPGGDPVPGHPGFPGIVAGLENSFGNTDGGALAAWSAVFNNPTGTVSLC